MQHRDVSFIDLSPDQVLVTACDSCGGIGEKEGDFVKAPFYIVGKLTARVCLMELISVKAAPIGMTVNICNEPEPAGTEILRGIRDELEETKLNIPIIISTEKNMKTSMTALGITIFGKAKKDEILLGKAKGGDYVYIFGEPLVGNDVLKNPDKICSSKLIMELIKLPCIKEIIPVGSGGIEGELHKFLKSSGLEIDFETNINIDLKKSGGPNTTAIIVSDEPLKDNYALAPFKLGMLKE